MKTQLESGPQFKEMTDLWSMKKKGMMPPPDFCLYLSHDRFERLLRYWAFGLEKCWGELLEKPWTEVQYWVQGFNKARRDELEVGTDLTPDEMMFAWRGKKGNESIPHLSLVERKHIPIPLGTELKCVCEGTFGLCTSVHLEIQTGKMSMARNCIAYARHTGIVIDRCFDVANNPLDMNVQTRLCPGDIGGVCLNFVHEGVCRVQKVGFMTLKLSDNSKQDEVNVIGNVFIVVLVEGVVLNIVIEEIRMKWNRSRLIFHGG
jgi:hypothetical protein